MLEFYINFWSSLRLFTMTKDRYTEGGHVAHLAHWYVARFAFWENEA
jgi:hypothetical protein